MSKLAYDALVVEHLECGASLETALRAAGSVYPEDQLLPETDEQWEFTAAHYGLLTSEDFPIKDDEEPESIIFRRNAKFVYFKRRVEIDGSFIDFVDLSTVEDVGRRLADDVKSPDDTVLIPVCGWSQFVVHDAQLQSGSYENVPPGHYLTLDVSPICDSDEDETVLSVYFNVETEHGRGALLSFIKKAERVLAVTEVRHTSDEDAAQCQSCADPLTAEEIDTGRDTCFDCYLERND